jgi:ABC-type transport system involved in Fe-S cluster assembly fused permease/ATPase subunit
LLLLYGALRFSTSLFTELREILFARVTQRAVRRIALEVFRHLHELSLRFHLQRQTGGVSRDIERGSRSISSLISYTLYSILPTLVEITLVLIILFVRYDSSFVLITLASLTAYIVFTVKVSNWRIAIRRQLNEMDSAANTRAIDSLLNYETVKYFNNEEYEARRYDQQMQHWEDAATRSQVSLSWLNLGQQVIIALGGDGDDVASSERRGRGHDDHRRSGAGQRFPDSALHAAQLPRRGVPRDPPVAGRHRAHVRPAAVNREIADAPDASLCRRPGGGPLSRCRLFYESEPADSARRRFRHSGRATVAVVGESGSGKSTLARLLYRFYDISGGHVLINGSDLRQLTQASLRAAIGIVPQDTVLFNDTIYYNIQYGQPEASREQVLAAASAAQLAGFIEQLPDGYETRVGERGLKLSGGEKQRVAIARALLKNPPVLIFDEATSALDSKTEKAIQASLDNAARGRTTLVIAHRLSTIMNADEILVMDAGRIVERGSHLSCSKPPACTRRCGPCSSSRRRRRVRESRHAWSRSLIVSAKKSQARLAFRLIPATAPSRRLRRLRCPLPADRATRQSHRRIVAITETTLQNPQVTAIAGGITRPEFVEHLDHHVPIAQSVESQATVGEARLLAERDDRLDHAAKLLGLRQRRLDDFFTQQRNGHVAQHRQTMGAGTIQFAKTQTVTHINSFLFLSGCSLLESGGRPVLELHAQCQAARGQHFLDFIQRLASEIGRLEQFVLGALDQITNVVDVFRLQTVGRTNRQFEVIHRTQQQGIDLHRF